MISFNRWVTLIAGMYMMMVSGTIYLFPDYSSHLKVVLGYSVEQTNLVGTLLNTGTWAGVIGGLFYDKFGPRLTSIIGSIIVFIGYFFMYLSLNGKVSGSVYLVGFFAFLAGQGSGWLYTAALNTNAANFTTEDRGKIMGLLTCCFGLCSGIFTLIYNTFFKGSVASFLGFLSLVIPIVGICIGAVFLNYLTSYPKNYAAEKRKINYAYVIMASIIFLLCITSFVTNFTNAKPFWFCVAVLAIISVLVWVPIRSEEGFTMSPTATLSVNESNTLIPDNNSELRNSGKMIGDFVSVEPKVGRKWGRVLDAGEQNAVNLPLYRVLMTADFYLLFFCFFANIGAGITILNNLNELVISLEEVPLFGTYQEKSLPYSKYIVTFVVLFSVFNTCGRLTVGMLSDRFLHRFSRSSWLIIISAFMTITQVYFLLTTIPTMFGGIFLLGISYGGTFSLLPTLTSEFFGLRNFGANFGFIGLAPAIGSELISVLLAGSLNDKFKSNNYITILSGTEDTDAVKTCLGRVCYRYTLFVTLGLCFLSIISASILSYRQRRHALSKGYIPSP